MTVPNYGLNEEELNTKLQQYNHALFQNMAMPLVLTWEVNLTACSVCVMHQVLGSFELKRDYGYPTFLEMFATEFVIEEDREAFLNQMDFRKLELLKREKTVETRLHYGSSTRRFRFVLTPNNEAGENWCVYISAINLQEDYDATARALHDEMAQAEKRRKKSRAGHWLYVLMLVWAVLLMVLPAVLKDGVNSYCYAVLGVLILLTTAFIAYVNARRARSLNHRLMAALSEAAGNAEKAARAEQTMNELKDKLQREREK